MRTLLVICALCVLGCGKAETTSTEPADWREEIPEGSQLVYDYERDGPLEAVDSQGTVILPDGSKAKIKVNGQPLQPSR